MCIFCKRNTYIFIVAIIIWRVPTFSKFVFSNCHRQLRKQITNRQRFGEDHNPETHLIPLVLQAALGKRDAIYVFGDDYSTKDGTCIRDYIHIVDLAQAHLLALERLLNGLPGGKYNLGNGNGYSVKDVIDVARNVTGMPITTKIAEKRPGDPAALVGSSEKAISELGWNSMYSDLHAIIETAWRWHKNNPNGYGVG